MSNKEELEKELGYDLPDSIALTVESIKNLKKKMEKFKIKPYRGYFGMGKNGIFQINNDRELMQMFSNEDKMIGNAIMKLQMVKK